MRTLVVGGYGNFGARICRALSGDSHIELLIGGRDAARCDALAAQLGNGACGAVIDIGAGGLEEVLRQLQVRLVIHTAGPFQAQDYRVAQAAADAGAHYIDLSDGRRFVCEFPKAMNAAFEAAGRLGVSGASTVPALSCAVVEHLSEGWQRIDAIDTCIAPAQSAPRGQATLAGVLSYCGEPVRVWDGARWQERRGWSDPERVTFARLRPRRGALCDIPDLELLPPRFSVARRVMFRAALEVGLAQRVFAALAALRARRMIPPPAWLAGVLTHLAPWMDWMGSALGGMVVRVEGADAAGRPRRRAWHIAADDDHGPEIPCMAAILIARRLARGDDSLPVGALACMGLLSLAEFEPEFVRWGMVTDIEG